MKKDGMKIFIISLKDEVERRESISNQLQKLDLSFEFLDAVNYRLEKNNYQYDYSTEMAHANLKRDLTSGEIGCALSHRAIYEKIVNEQLEIALILEDDAEIDPGVVEIIYQVKQYTNVFDVLILGYSKLDKTRYNKFYRREPISLAKFQIGQYQFGEVFSNWTCGSVGYLITNSGASKMLIAQNPIRHLADSWDFFSNIHDLEILHSRPLAIHEQFQKLKSSLEIERNKIIKKSNYRSLLVEYIMMAGKIALITTGLLFPLAKLKKQLKSKNKIPQITRLQSKKCKKNHLKKM